MGNNKLTTIEWILFRIKVWKLSCEKAAKGDRLCYGIWCYSNHHLQDKHQLSVLAAMHVKQKLPAKLWNTFIRSTNIASSNQSSFVKQHKGKSFKLTKKTFSNLFYRAYKLDLFSGNFLENQGELAPLVYIQQGFSVTESTHISQTVSRAKKLGLSLIW